MLNSYANYKARLKSKLDQKYKNPIIRWGKKKKIAIWLIQEEKVATVLVSLINWDTLTAGYSNTQSDLVNSRTISAGSKTTFNFKTPKSKVIGTKLLKQSGGTRGVSGEHSEGR